MVKYGSERGGWCSRVRVGSHGLGFGSSSARNGIVSLFIRD